MPPTSDTGSAPPPTRPLQDAAHRKSAPLPVVEGAMVLLELMALQQQQQGEQGGSNEDE